MRALLVCVALVACGDDAARTDATARDTSDTLETNEVVVPSGVAVWLTSIRVAEGSPRRVVIQLDADGLQFEVGAAPTYRVVPREGEAEQLRRTPLSLVPGERRELGPVLVAWVPKVPETAVAVRVIEDDVVLLDERVTFGATSPMTVASDGIELGFTTAIDLPPPPEHRTIGLHIDGAYPFDEALSQPIGVKVYAGARRWLLKPGCDSDAQCAEGGESFPCVSTCACECNDTGCDCDFSGLEAYMEQTALAAMRRVTGELGSDREAAQRVRIHWVFKRSLGGSTQCDVNGELDVSPETYGRFFEAAVVAAANIDTRLDAPLIHIVSPMNEANHPLQDGAHVNAAGQPTIGGFLSFVDAIVQTSCAGGHCCAPDRYIVAAPDVPALLREALLRGAARAELLDSGRVPHIGLSVYLDADQVDPLQLDEDGDAPPIVTPAGQFFEALAARDGSVLPSALVVDTYPGSWGAPWFETPDRIVHHMDPSSARIVRVDPVWAADQALERAFAAGDAYAAAFATRAPYLMLGEVGWSTFDGDEEAQARFARRLLDQSAARSEDHFGGFIWFRSHDRADFSYPTWTSAPSPLGGEEVACADGIGPIICAADVLQQMEGQWGLRRRDDSPKPAWRAFFDRWARLVTPDD